MAGERTLTDAELSAALPFLDGAPAAVKNELLHRAARVTVPADAAICREGNHCAHMSLLLAGSARVFKVGESGREITLYRLGPGDSCILTASCILSDLSFPAHAVTEQEVDALAIPAPVFRDWVVRHETWRRYVFGLASRRLASVISLIEEVAFRRMDDRLAEYLAARVAADPGQAVLHTTHEAVAADLGSSREVVSRLLKELEHRGAVSLARGTITILDRGLLDHPAG